MDEEEHGHYVQFFDWKTLENGETGIYSRLLDTGKRPLYDMEQNAEDIVAGTAKRLTQKKLDRLYTSAYARPDEKLLIKARWFIKQNDNFTYPPAQVHPPVKVAYRTALAHAIKKIDSLDPNRRLKVERMLTERPKEFKTALKNFMSAREADFLQERASKLHDEVEALQNVQSAMGDYAEETQQYCEAKLIKK